MEKTCKIILVDDHSLFRNGLRGLLAAHPGYEVVGEAASGEEFLAMLPALAADVAFMDIAMPGMAGDEATVQALGLQPDLKIITLSMYGEEVYYTRMMTAGAKGFLLKDSDFSEVMLMIGVGFKLNGDSSQPGKIVRILAARYSLAIILALVFYFLLPFGIEYRQALTILALSPMSSAAPAFTGNLGSDVGLASAVNSISVVISTVLITGTLMMIL